MNRKHSRIVMAALALAAAAFTAAGVYFGYLRQPPAGPGPDPDDLQKLALPGPGQAGTGRSGPAASQSEADRLKALAAKLGDASGRDLLADVGGLAVTEGEPGGLPAPPDSRRLEGQASPGGQQARARYLAKAAPDVLKSWYAKSLGERGWRQSARGGGGGDLVYIGPRQYCVITLRPTGQGTEVTVVVSGLPK